MNESMSLAELLAGLRGELAEAARWQRERGGENAVPPLLVKEVKVETEVVVERTTEGKLGFSFYLVADGARKNIEKRTHKVALTLVPDPMTGQLELGEGEQPDAFGYSDPTNK